MTSTKLLSQWKVAMSRTDLLELIKAIRAVESSNGVTSRNELQITPICIADVNRLYRTHYTIADALDRVKSEEIAVLYLSYWADKAAMPKNAELYARIWNGGPNGWKKRSTLSYWHKVRKHLRRM